MLAADPVDKARIDEAEPQPGGLLSETDEH